MIVRLIFHHKTYGYSVSSDKQLEGYCSHRWYVGIMTCSAGMAADVAILLCNKNCAYVHQSRLREI